MISEIFTTDISAHGARCAGCEKHNKKLMISFRDGVGKVHDIFVNEKDALFFQKALDRAMLESKDSV